MNLNNRYTTLLAGFTLAIATACGDGDSDSSNEETPDAAASDDEMTPDSDDETPDEDSGSPMEDDDADPDDVPSDPGDPDGSAPDADDDAGAVGNIVEVARGAGSFDTLLAAAEAADLVDALSGDGPLTVFAPTDAAFEALPEGTVDALLDDPEELAAVLSYHVVGERVVSMDIEDGTEVDTLLGPWLTASVDGSTVSIEGATVTSADVLASNGVIHVIDSVLMPPPAIADLAVASDDLSTLTAALEAAELTETLNGSGPFTVFAPTDAAFDALPEGALDALLADDEALTEVLLYHVVEGRQRAVDVIALEDVETIGGELAEISVEGDVVRIAGAEIVATDIAARNGVVHLIDAVMLPPNLELPGSEGSPDGGPDGGAPTANLVETAIAAGGFETLVAAAEAAGLTETLSGDGPFTVFAPTDAAFAALPDGVLDALLADPDELAAVLTYHVVPGALPSESISDGARVDTVLGPWLTATVSDEGVSVGDASVTTADVLASNGVIHVIDQVLIPPATIAEIAAANDDLSTLVTAIEAAGLTETLSGPGPFTVFAPTDAAFDALPDGTLEALLDDTDALTEVLLYHVIGSREPASSVLEASEFEMLSGQSASVELMDDDVLVAGARVVATDIVARNGVIHVIESVMLPPTE